MQAPESRNGRSHGITQKNRAETHGNISKACLTRCDANLKRPRAFRPVLWRRQPGLPKSNGAGIFRDTNPEEVAVAVNALPYSAPPVKPSAAPRLIRAWLTTAVSDGIFSSVLVTVFYGSTFARLWQGVASVPLGAKALDGGAQSVLVGLLIHLCVALTWSTVFLVLWMASAAMQRAVSTWRGAIAVASVYGPCIWVFMSLVLIPTLTHKPPTINYRWWVQFFGHIPFVAFPIVATIGRWRIGPALR